MVPANMPGGNKSGGLVIDRLGGESAGIVSDAGGTLGEVSVDGDGSCSGGILACNSLATR